jgi:hypothetical protein
MVVTTSINPANYISSTNTTPPISNNKESINIVSNITTPPISNNTESISIVPNIITPSNNIILEDYTKTHGYKSGLALFISWGIVAILVILLAIKYIVKFNSSVYNILLQYGFIIAIITVFVTSALSIHYNKVEIDKNGNKYDSKYKSWINGSWILGVIYYSFIGCIFVILLIIGMFSNKNVGNSFNNRYRR